MRLEPPPLREDELDELRDEEPLPLFELRDRLPLAFDDEPDALLRAVFAVRLAALLPLERAVEPVFFAAVDPLLAAVFAVLPAVEAALRPDDAALRAVDRVLLDDEPFDERREPPERDDELDREDELRDDDPLPLRERDDPPLLRDDDERDDDERDDERDRDEEDADLRSFAGISVLTTSFVSRGICFST